MDNNTPKEKMDYYNQNIQPIQQQSNVLSSNRQGLQQPYAQPVIIQQGDPNAIIVNQNSPVVMIAQPSMGTSPVSIICPFCRTPITTNVEQVFNCVACLLCWCTGFLCFVCIQCCMGKEIGCCDAIHICPRCGSKIGRYHAI